MRKTILALPKYSIIETKLLLTEFICSYCTL